MVFLLSNGILCIVVGYLITWLEERAQVISTIFQFDLLRE